MNNIFSFKRFALLIKAHWMENKKRELLVLAVIIAMLILSFIQPLAFIIKSNNSPESNNTRIITYDFIRAISLCAIFLITSTALFFKSISSKKNAMFTLSTPASAFERTSVAFLFYMIVYPLILLALIYIVDFLVVGIYANTHGINRTTLGFNELSFNEYFGFFTILAAMIFGNAYFGKNGMIKSLLCVIVFFGLQLIIVERLLPESSFLIGEISEMKFRTTSTNQTVTINGFMYYLKYLLFPLFWVLTFLCFKKKEV
ncbi:hypothetical protein LJC30_00985 [Odoribacter sp. OttesenSCG-928-L07]|nr:hypothetical protein [Odoribacter sp. OttesenSCG-928-L07]MDL2239513.1 hypothetical protein [Bacteroidales bacterium OttesenSCG-928-L14]